MKAFLKIQPKSENDIKCDNDCMIRSVALVTNSIYSDVHKIMYNNGWRASRRKSIGNWEDQIVKTLDELGFKSEKISYPAIKGNTRMTAQKMSNDGDYILRMSKHVACMSNGILKDTFDCSDKCVYFAWRVSKKDA